MPEIDDPTLIFNSHLTDIIIIDRDVANLANNLCKVADDAKQLEQA